MKRTSLILTALCLTLLICSQAMAQQHSGPYIGAFIGGNALMSAKGSDDVGDFGLEFNPAPLGSVVLGWDFEKGNPVGEGRVELEFSHRSNPLDQVKFTKGSFAAGGNVTADSLLLNFFGVPRDTGRWAPYIGVGIGAARIEAADLKVTGQPMSSGSAVVFAYQMGAGVDIALTERLSLDFGYRFFSSARPKFTEVNGHVFAMDYLNHSAVLGLRVGF